MARTFKVGDYVRIKQSTWSICSPTIPAIGRIVERDPRKFWRADSSGTTVSVARIQIVGGIPGQPGQSTRLFSPDQFDVIDKETYMFELLKQRVA